MDSNKNVDLYAICEKYNRIIAEKERKAKNEIIKTGLIDLSQIKLEVIGEIEWQPQTHTQQKLEGSLRLEDKRFHVNTIHQFYRSVQLLSGKVNGIYNPLKLRVPDGLEITIDPGCESCVYKQEREITVEGVCPRKEPQIVLSLTDVKEKYYFFCTVLCKGSVKLLVEDSVEVQNILEIVRTTQEYSLIRNVKNEDVVCWSIDGLYTTNCNSMHHVTIN